MTLSKNTVAHDLFDRGTWEESLAETEGLSDAVKRCKTELGTCEPLAEDLFFDLYKYNPALLPEAEIEPGHRFNRSLVQRAQEMPEHAKLRSFTKSDAMQSVMGASLILEHVTKNLTPEEKKRIKDQAKQAENLEQQLEDLKKALEKAEEAAENPPFNSDGTPAPPEGPTPEEVQEQIQQTQQAAKKLEQNIQATIDQTAQRTRQAVREGLSAAVQDARDVTEFASGYGIEPGELKRLPFQERVALAKRIRSNHKLQEVARELGRVRRLAFAKQQARVKKVPTEIAKVRLGNDVPDVLISEKALLADETLENLWWLRYATEDLVQHDYKGREFVGKGPIIACYDGSSSMTGFREVWAKAIVLTLADLARAQGRDFAAIQFGSKTQVKVWRFPKGQPEKERLTSILEVAEFWFAGGTDFETPLTEAMKVIEESAFNKADVVFITDGEAAVSAAWLREYKKLKAAKEFRNYGILVGTSPPQVMRDLCDIAISIVDVLKEADKNNLDKGMFIFEELTPP